MREYGNRALDGAYRKGREAKRAGKALTANPYKDVRNRLGRVTFSRAFCTAWREGWRDEEDGR